MVKRWRKWLYGLLILGGGIILMGGLRYVSSLRTDLMDQAVGNVLTVTRQQQQAFDSFISGDRERLHSYADYFARSNSKDVSAIQDKLMLFSEVDAYYTVINLSDGSLYSNKTSEVHRMSQRDLETYRNLTGSGVRNPFTGIYTSETMFGYYECFTFADNAQGLIQKSYDCSEVSKTFSLSFYNDRGLAYVVNQDGDILLRSMGMLGDHLYSNILEVINEFHDKGVDAQSLEAALASRDAGSIVLAGSTGSYVYTYVPVENVSNWDLVSIVSQDAITEETDRILMSSRVSVAILMVILAVCAVVLLLIWGIRRDLDQKDRTIRYQEELFDIFATYLSSNTDDVYMLLDLAQSRVEYVSPNVERVMGIPADKINADLRAFAGSAGEGGEHLDVDQLYAMQPGDAMPPLSSVWTNPTTKEPQWLRVQFYCRSVQGQPRMVLYISNRTEEQKARDCLVEALNLAQTASNAKSAFLSSVSHDIRTPLNAIIGLSALLQQDPSDSDVVLEYAQRIDAASQHLLGLINDVLDMNKIESGNASLNQSEMDMASVIEEINTIIRPQAKAKKQSLEIYVPPMCHEHLIGDKLRINQVLINLLSNAVKYTQAGGRIEMRVEELPQVVEEYSRIRFTIRDNGMGMSPEYLKVIFDPFTREETSATREIQGTGLGMAITKSLVDLMSGTIEVESTLNEGSTFVVELELYIQEQEDDPAFWRNHGVSRMIVADDEEEICHGIVETMRNSGVVVHYSTDGERAIQMMRTAREQGEPYDLILLDWKMPGLNGLETARVIRKNYPERIPILLFTAYDWSDIEQEAREIGVNHFMPKPFFLSSFKTAISRVMGSQKSAKSDEESLLKEKRILVVDDIEVNRIILVKILRAQGAECDTAENGQEALEAFRQAPPGTYDLILMDVQMPIMDGYAATRAIRSSGCPDCDTVPIIAMTANAFVDDVRDAIAAGMDAHVAKPVQVDKLTATIRQVLNSREIENMEGDQSA